MVMRYQKLDLNLLTGLRVLLVEKSVTRAGEVMHITQSAMSGVLARLRDYFEDPLIVPVGRRMELTPLAESLVEPLNDLLLRIDATMAIRPEFNPRSTRRRFKIVASDYAISVLLLEVLRKVHHQAPGLSLEFSQPTEEMAADLDSGEVDLIISPEHFASQAQSRSVLFEDDYTLMIDEQHPHRDSGMSLEQYVSFGHVSYSSGKMSGSPYFETWFGNRHGDSRHLEVLVNSFQILPSLVLGTTRIATLHTRLAQQFVGKLPVRLIKPAFETPRLVQVLQWHKYRDLDPGNVWLRGLILEQAKTLPPLGN
jgi:DNA-binding transcriptional LysR family regulator